MKISVITPSYNQGPYIRRCLESVEPVDGFEIEHIILDNLSTDETTEVLNDFRARRDGVSRTIIVKKDSGQTDAINEGWRLATGDVICWLNTDEFFHRDTLSKVAKHFSSNAECDVLYGGVNFIDKFGRILKSQMPPPFKYELLLYYGCYIQSASTFIRRRVIDEGNFLDPAFKVAMDLEYYLRLYNKGYKFNHIREILSSFTWHDSNISTNLSKRRREERSILLKEYSAIQGPGVVRFISHRVLFLFWKVYLKIHRVLS